MSKFQYRFLLFSIISITACFGNRIGDQNTWLNPPIDVNFLQEAEDNNDIPSIDQPKFTIASKVNFLPDTATVLAINHDGVQKAYPLDILHWHEVVNDVVGETPVAITYSTLSGSGIAFERVSNNGFVFEMGVTGFLYNANLIVSDRLSGTYWLQITGQGVKGIRRPQQLKEIPLIEMKWATWRLLFPNSEVLNTSTGFNRPYQTYPYGDYRTNDNKDLVDLTVPLESLDSIISFKEKALGIIIGVDTMVYPISVFPEKGMGLIEDEFSGEQVVVVGSQEHQFLAAYDRKRSDNSIASLQIADSTQFTLMDERGITYNLFGKSTNGSDTLFLAPMNAKTSFWFSWAVWSHPNKIPIYQ